MNELHAELTELDLDGLDLESLGIQETGHLLSRGGLEALTLGHGMTEIGASIVAARPTTSALFPFPPLCCSCCCCDGIG